MIHIIDEISFSEVTCDLKRFELLQNNNFIRMHTFELGLLFLNTLKIKIKINFPKFDSFQQGQEEHLTVESDERQKSFTYSMSYFIYLSKRINWKDIGNRSHQQFYSRYMMTIKEKMNSTHFPDEREIMLFLRLQNYFHKLFAFSFEEFLFKTESYISVRMMSRNKIINKR